MVVFLIILFMFVAQLNCGLVANAEEEKLTFSTSIVEDNGLINLNTTNISQFNNSRFIENSRYFYLNPLHHSNGSSDSKNGVCSTVAMQLLLGYHNYYTHRGIIPFSKSDGTPFLASDFGTILKHPYLEGNISYDNDYLGSSALGTEPGFFDEIKDLTFGGELLDQMLPLVKEAAMEFIDLYSSEEVKDDITMNFSAFSNDVARAEINAGRPLLLCYKGIEFENDPTTDEDNEKSYHVVVAYGYATYNGEQGFIVHMGYKNDETQVWVPASWFGWQLTMSVNHTHTMIDAQDNHAYAYREIHCTSCGFKDLDEIYNTDSTGTIITGVNYLLNI